MKKFLIRIAVLTFVLLLAKSVPTYAAEVPRIKLKAEDIKEGDTYVTVSCEITGACEVANGKIRMEYDGHKMKLESVKAGNALEGAMYEINDPLSGNKEEGEIVLAFATATHLENDGSMVDMVFKLDSGIKAGTVLEATVTVDQLAKDNKEVGSEVEKLSVEVGEVNETEPTQPSESETETDPSGNDNKEETEDQNDTGDDKDQGSGKENGHKDQSSYGDRNQNSNKNNGNSEVKAPKTGDETNITVLLVVTGLSSMVLLGLVAWKRRRY
ncbi:MAG TPA: LPXTG cell wall anchor domain-containing protein [Candidatus Merdenecus merdavium]|nr:LPXTG cell wall anchor domain-containing protein [Candidatus Merdenecus merdavium]